MGKATQIRLPRSIALSVAQRFINLLVEKECCEKYSVAGSLRREEGDAGDIEIVVVPKYEEELDGLFKESKWVSKVDKVFNKDYPGIKKNGPRYKQFQYTSIEFPQIKNYSHDNDSVLQIDLFITSLSDYGRMLAIRTGSATYSKKVLAGGWTRKGWVGTSEGLRKRKECEKKTEFSPYTLKPQFKDNPTMPPEFITEADFFHFIEKPYEPPQNRSWK